MAEALPPGSTVGILGGGQLGRMLAIAAAQLGLKARIYAPETAHPAGDVAPSSHGAWDDEAALAAFAAEVDVVTYEFENVPLRTASILSAHAPVRPGPRALEAAQDRVTEKSFLNEIGVVTAPWAAVDGAEGLRAALAQIGAPAILKTRRLGYDGKGQARIMKAGDAEGALAAMNGAPAILEGFVPFTREVSIIAARGLDGEIRAFPAAENVHEDGILRRSSAPAAAPGAEEIAARILEALDYVGVIGVEFFDTGEALLVNEIAPRVHNTGHWTIEACATDQFQQHIRAICGWPLGAPAPHARAVMENLIGAESDDWRRLAAEPGAALHLYGKAEARAGRKMGHVTRVAPLD